jgi:predicted ABC-type ATPase
MTAARPTLYVIAGPNGAGKTTFYNTVLKDMLVGVAFVNADQLAAARFGRNATTDAESKAGQDLAESHRRQLMAGRQSLVMESTFSHPSKLELLDAARALGYRVVVFHVHIVSADLAVMRVDARVADGGHPVPEARIRARYVRNQAFIRQAAAGADWAYVFDNSRLDRPPRRLFTLQHGRATEIQADIPAWASSLYAAELAAARAG